jgi:hypothetical protein
MQCVNVSFSWHNDLHLAARKLHLFPSLQNAMLCYVRQELELPLLSHAVCFEDRRQLLKVSQQRSLPWKRALTLMIVIQKTRGP